MITQVEDRQVRKGKSLFRISQTGKSVCYSGYNLQL